MSVLSKSHVRGAVVSSILIALLAGHVPAAAQSSPELPPPSGARRTGTTIFHLVDTSRGDFITKKPGQFRELMVQLWYPARPSRAATPAPYVPDRRVLDAMRRDGYYEQSPATLDALQQVRTHSALDAPPEAGKSRLPLLLLSHGLGSPRWQYTALAEDLASHGYVVACIDHPYGGLTALPGGRVLSAASDDAAGTPEGARERSLMWASDASFVLDKLTTSPARETRAFARHVDAGRVGMFGHSLGGAAALEACLADARFLACADLDGAPFGKVEERGIGKPTLLMLSSPIYSDEEQRKKGRTPEMVEAMGRERRALFEGIITKAGRVPAYYVRVSGTGHMSFSDAPFVMPDLITRFGGRIIDAKRGHEIVTAYLRQFFDRHLRGVPGELLKGASEHYPEVRIEVFPR
jgi:pimeloyl-ACP methyl ester carboxylesterase